MVASSSCAAWHPCLGLRGLPKPSGGGLEGPSRASPEISLTSTRKDLLQAPTSQESCQSGCSLPAFAEAEECRRHKQSPQRLASFGCFGCLEFGVPSQDAGTSCPGSHHPTWCLQSCRRRRQGLSRKKGWPGQRQGRKPRFKAVSSLAALPKRNSLSLPFKRTQSFMQVRSR